MSTDTDRERLLEQVRREFQAAGKAWVGRRQFLQRTGLKDADIFRFFARWSDAVAAAGIDLRPYNQKIPPEDLLEDWGDVTRKLGRIPTRNEYKLHGSYSAGVFESNFGPWSAIPDAFRRFAQDRPDFGDVLALLPDDIPPLPRTVASSQSVEPFGRVSPRAQRLSDRPIYGDPIDFRGLRHAPVNENGVVFLFGMVARELGYLVEAIQSGFPDCEAKRQVTRGQWQRVRIEFEFESRHFAEHGHRAEDCDVIVCWRHNWPDVPSHLEVVELSSLLPTLGIGTE